MPLIYPSDLAGRLFLMNTNDNGEKLSAHVVEAVHLYGDELNGHPDHIKFVCSINDDKYELILSYSEILQHIEKDTEVVEVLNESVHMNPYR